MPVTLTLLATACGYILQRDEKVSTKSERQIRQNVLKLHKKLCNMGTLWMRFSSSPFQSEPLWLCTIY